MFSLRKTQNHSVNILVKSWLLSTNSVYTEFFLGGVTLHFLFYFFVLFAVAQTNWVSESEIECTQGEMVVNEGNSIMILS